MTTKRRENDESNTEAPVKSKKLKTKPISTDGNQKNSQVKKVTFEKKTKPKKSFPKPEKSTKPKTIELTEKPADWNEFKKKKKELRLKRRQNRPAFDIVIKAKQMGEKLRCKTLKGGDIERNKLINELHSLLKNKGHYAKFVLAHDTSRVVQWMLKYSSDIIKEQISKELVPITVDMLQSKYAIFCVKRLLKYGNQSTKTAIVDRLLGHVVRLSTRAISAPVVEYAYTTCATPLQKQHLVQEFFSDIYKNSKDDKVKCLRDVFEQSPSLKSAVLGATKANLVKVINKGLLDSALVQTVLQQYLAECSSEDRAELIPQLVPHIVVISNSKDGARAAMFVLWHGSTKDRKAAMKTIKEHVLELAKHEHGHCTIIALLDAIDDTVLLHKIVLGEILKGAKELAVDEWGRKVLLWLVAPADTNFFHPLFVGELEKGRAESTSKKDPETRRREILAYSNKVLLDLVAEEPQFWLKNSSLAYEMLAIMKAGEGEAAKRAFESVVRTIIDPDWRIKTKDGQEVAGIEDAGIHMVLKKLAKNDEKIQDGRLTFGSSLLEALTDEILSDWLTKNRGCFLLVAVYESAAIEVKNTLITMLKRHKKLLKSHETPGSKILLKKLKECDE